MVPKPTTRRWNSDERAYLYARLVAIVLLSGFYAFDIIVPQTDLLRLVYVGSLGLLVVGTMSVLIANRRFGVSVETAMLAVLPLDLIVVTAFTFLGVRDDAFYPMCVLLSVLFGLVLRKREAWFVAAAISVAYMAGHALTPADEVVDYVIFALKAISLPLVGSLVANSMGKQRLREDEATQAVEQRAVLNEELRQHIVELQAVSEINELIHSTLDFDAIGQAVLDILAGVIGIQSCTLLVIDKEKSETLFSASVGAEDGSIALPLDGVTPDPGSFDGHFDCLSLFNTDRVMVLFCASAEEIASLSPESRRVASSVASELVVAVENSRLYDLSQRLAITDELTGLFNYRHLQKRLDDEIARAKRFSNHVSMLMIDADDFKRFNDTHGHIAGDGALTELASVMRSVVREIDVVARYGGEEFSIVLPETDSAGAFVAAEKVREAIATHRFADANGTRDCPLTVSIGLASYPTHAWDKESLLREADDALYRAKNGGKNRVRTPKRTTEGVAIDPSSAAAGLDSPHTETPANYSAPTDDPTGDRS